VSGKDVEESHCIVDHMDSLGKFHFHVNKAEHRKGESMEWVCVEHHTVNESVDTAIQWIIVRTIGGDWIPDAVVWTAAWESLGLRM
jgi:hypothetical protein